MNVAVICFVVALVVALFGFTGVVIGFAATVAKALFVMFSLFATALFLLALIKDPESSD